MSKKCEYNIMEKRVNMRGNIMREFFGFGGFTRVAEGYMSWEHLTFVTSLVSVMILLAVLFGVKNRNADTNKKNRVLIVCAILIDTIEIFKIVILSFRQQSALHFLTDLPLFLCSIQLITIPIAAFSKGRLKGAALDFVAIFGMLGAVLGTYFAGNNYGVYPVLSFDNVVSGVTHCISGFASLYILVSGMADMKRKNIPITFGILGSFCAAAYIANVLLDYNYMFLMRGDGTPYDIIFNIVNGDPLLYPLAVLALFVVYITAFYYVYYAFSGIIKKSNNGTIQ